MRFLAEERFESAKRFGWGKPCYLVRDYQSLDIYQTHLDRETHQSGDIVNVEALH